MSEERPGRLRRLRQRLPAVRTAAAPRVRVVASAIGRTRPRRTSATGIPTLDDLLNPQTDDAAPTAWPAQDARRDDPAVSTDEHQEAEPGDRARPDGGTATARTTSAVATPDGTASARTTPAGTASGGATPRRVPDDRQRRFGAPGQPINRTHPFYIGFVGALGVLIAYGLVSLLDALSSVITLLGVSLFLALGLDPVVRWLQARGTPRPAAITIVFLGVVTVFAAFVSSVIPPVVAQATALVTQLPQYAEDLQRFVEESPQLSRFDEEYQLTERIQAELEQRVSSGETVTAIFGGIFGAGRVVVSGIFSALTVLVLTLYFLASLHGMKTAAYRLVPASRRRRVKLLGDEVSKRIGGYVGGQLLLASINGVATFVVLSVMEIPFAAVLAFTVGLLGIIPLVGATLGAVIVVVVALFTSLTDALILSVYYLVYQQVENYVLAPRIMARTVSVPGAVALVAALAGGSLLGILGALIAIPLAAGALLIVQEVWMPQQDRS